MKSMAEMTIKDFHVGQKVWIKLTGNLGRGYSERHLIDNMQECEVIKVGRKHVTVQFGEYRTIQFDSTNNFFEHSNYSADYEMYLDKQQAEEYIMTRVLCRDLGNKITYGINSIPYDKLKRIEAILNE